MTVVSSQGGGLLNKGDGHIHKYIMYHFIDTYDYYCFEITLLSALTQEICMYVQNTEHFQERQNFPEYLVGSLILCFA